MTARNSIAVGAVFVFIAFIYWLIPTLTGGIVDYAGITMLLALGAAMSLMVWVLLLSLARN